MPPHERVGPRRPCWRASLLRRGASLALGAGLLALAADARAQCGAKRSTCSGCHDGAHAAYGAAEPWHADHAFADLCVACHGGHGDARESAAAHVDRASEVPATSCTPCHAATGGGAPERYAYARPSPGPSAPGPAPVASAPARTSPPHGGRRGNTIVGLLAAALGAAGLAIVVRKERRR
jgi:hypothetical protein